VGVRGVPRRWPEAGGGTEPERGRRSDLSSHNETIPFTDHRLGLLSLTDLPARAKASLSVREPPICSIEG
jgi:hypothetical protein